MYFLLDGNKILKSRLKVYLEETLSKCCIWDLRHCRASTASMNLQPAKNKQGVRRWFAGPPLRWQSQFLSPKIPLSFGFFEVRTFFAEEVPLYILHIRGLSFRLLWEEDHVDCRRGISSLLFRKGNPHFKEGFC